MRHHAQRSTIDAGADSLHANIRNRCGNALRASGSWSQGELGCLPALLAKALMPPTARPATPEIMPNFISFLLPVMPPRADVTPPTNARAGSDIAKSHRPANERCRARCRPAAVAMPPITATAGIFPPAEWKLGHYKIVKTLIAPGALELNALLNRSLASSPMGTLVVKNPRRLSSGARKARISLRVSRNPGS